MPGRERSAFWLTTMGPGSRPPSARSSSSAFAEATPPATAAREAAGWDWRSRTPSSVHTAAGSGRMTRPWAAPASYRGAGLRTGRRPRQLAVRVGHPVVVERLGEGLLVDALFDGHFAKRPA